MKEITLKESKKIQLEMLRSLDSFCRSHDIDYSLAWGSLLGAVRHKGFIPWDDDIDVTMTRDNFDRFVNAYKSDKYELREPMRSDRWEFYAKIVDPSTVVKFNKHPFSKFGIWITIFPMDNRPEDDMKWKEMKKRLERYTTLARMKYATWDRSWVRNLIKLILHIVLIPIPIRFINRKVTSIIHSCDNSHIPLSKFVWQGYNKYYYYPDSVANEYTDKPFEDLIVRTIVDYDTYLKVTYGDYMKLPPLSEQVPKHDYKAYYL